MAGSIRKTLDIGDVVIATTALSEEGLSPQRGHNYWPCPINKAPLPAEFPADPHLLRHALRIAEDFPVTIQTGAVVNSDYFPLPPWFMDVYRAKDVASIDMESSMFAQACWLFGVPQIIIRGISNEVDEHTTVSFTQDMMHASTENAALFVAALIEALP